jgi:hypothetical protein
MASSIVYHQIGDRVFTATSNPASAEMYGDSVLVRRFDDVFGHVIAGEDSLITTLGEVFYSSCGVYDPQAVHDLWVGNSDGLNGCWSPNPCNAIPEYVGVRFPSPVRITGFQFATNLSSNQYCPLGAGPCGYPTAFTLEASNDELNWTTLLQEPAFTGMRTTFESPYAGEDSSWWDEGAYVSDRMDVANDHYFLAYRMVVTAFKPDKAGNYSVAELYFYGAQ